MVNNELCSVWREKRKKDITTVDMEFYCMRLFIAIQLTDQLRDEICRMQDRFDAQRIIGNYTKRENLHLTLAFIGEYADWERALDTIRSVPLKPFDLSLKGIGAFGDLWWVGIEESKLLTTYVTALRHALADAGIPYDRKRFTPHITILRRAMTDGTVRLPYAPRGTMRVKRISLMRSDRGRNGMIYTELS